MSDGFDAADPVPGLIPSQSPPGSYSEEPPVCLNRGSGDCNGTVEYRESLSGTGRMVPRCDKHWSDRLDLEQELRERYPVNPPSDWSPLDAGEAWGPDDY